MSEKKAGPGGRGTQLHVANPYHKAQYGQFEISGLDEWETIPRATEFFEEHARSILQKVNSPDVPAGYSLNPYQGCEHGCLYCYARPTHAYYGFSAGDDFEQKIMVKKNAAELLDKAFMKTDWVPRPVMMAGNTDAYQPAEAKFRISRQILEKCLEFGNPVSVITKNSLITRDLDILSELAAKGLVHVAISITTLDEKLRRLLEPRTATGRKRLATIEALVEAGVPVMVMNAPVIPFLNSHETPEILRAAADAGALDAGTVIVRLNPPVDEIFTDWIQKNFPDRAQRVLNAIADAHGGKLGDSRFGLRMRGEGALAESVMNVFRLARKKNFANKGLPPFQMQWFKRPQRGQLRLFE